jgi:hypothetical protein
MTMTGTSKTNKELLELDVALGVLHNTLLQLDYRFDLGYHGMRDVATRLLVLCDAFDGKLTKDEQRTFELAHEQAIAGWDALPLVKKDADRGIETLSCALDDLLEINGPPMNKTESASLSASLRTKPPA